MSQNEITIKPKLVKGKPVFDWRYFPKGTHAKTYGGAVVRLLGADNNNARWGWGRTAKAVAFTTPSTHWANEDKTEKDINPNTVCFPRMKTSEIDLRGLPIGTRFKTDWRNEYKEIIAINPQDSQPIKCDRYWWSTAENPEGEWEVGNRNYEHTKQGYQYGASYRTARSAHDLFYEKIILPEDDAVHQEQVKQQEIAEQKYEDAMSIFDYA